MTASTGTPLLDSYMPNKAYYRAVSTFEVLAEPNRRRILDLLRASESPVGELVGRLELSQPAVSKHLRVLREAGLVEARVDAQRRVYRVRPEPLRALDEWLAPYRRMWASSLDDLEHHLDAMTDDADREQGGRDARA
jgi:DNA-binding transcriptional ArsR family regulator